MFGAFRALAQRSAQAAKEIKTLISESVSKVSTGSVQVERAGETMREIVASAQRMTDIMGEIAAASQEQSAGIEQVNRAVTQMDQATQQNAALVEQSSAASVSLEQQSSQLQTAVARFRLAPTDGQQSMARPVVQLAHASLARQVQPDSQLLMGQRKSVTISRGGTQPVRVPLGLS